MNDQKNMTIGVLAITAVILLTAVVLTIGGSGKAMAMGQIDRGGDYILVTGQFSDSSELIYITDAAAQRMNIYSYDTTTRQFTLWDTVDLRRTFTQAGP